MNLIQSRRNATIQAINLNPSNIAISRMIVTKIAGGKSTTPTTIPTQVFRLYTINQNTTEYSGTGGQGQKETYKLLCPFDADIQKNDEFSLHNTGYVTNKVTPIYFQGEIVSKQCIVEMRV